MNLDWNFILHTALENGNKLFIWQGHTIFVCWFGQGSCPTDFYRCQNSTKKSSIPRAPAALPRHQTPGLLWGSLPTPAPCVPKGRRLTSVVEVAQPKYGLTFSAVLGWLLTSSLFGNDTESIANTHQAQRRICCVTNHTLLNHICKRGMWGFVWENDCMVT